jgi:GT2 family glycosyltransferase
MAKEASIIIVNYNGERYLSKLFDSIACQTTSNYEIFFVDNASTDNSVKIVEARKDLSINIIKNTENLGFCIANNQAVKLCTGKFLVFLNNDTYVDRNWLKRLIEKANDSSKNAVVVSSILSPSSQEITEGPMQYDFYGASMGLNNQHFFYGTGASILIKKDFLKNTDAFDSKLFMYQEDVDLCWRARIWGFNVAYEPESLCYHLSESHGLFEDTLVMAPLKFYHAHCKNRIRILVKNYSKRSISKILPAAIFLIFARSLLMSVISKSTIYMQLFFRGFLWNMKNLKSTLIERYKIQLLRKVSDKEVLKYMLPYSVELSSIKPLLLNRKGLA